MSTLTLSPPTSNAYKGLRIHALPGLHDYVALLAEEHLKGNGLVLDLAAGSGAMSLRLQDMGYSVTASDIVPDNFRLHGNIPFVLANLNEPFASQYSERFEGIVASEIIEHLENPRHFFRECFRLLADGGKLILTTPNLDNAASLASFLRSGCFMWFSEKDYRIQGHITPITQWQLQKCAEEAGFSVLWKGSYGNPLTHLKGSPRLQLVARILDRLLGNDRRLRGEIYTAVFQRPF